MSAKSFEILNKVNKVLKSMNIRPIIKEVDECLMDGFCIDDGKLMYYEHKSDKEDKEEIKYTFNNEDDFVAYVVLRHTWNNVIVMFNSIFVDSTGIGDLCKIVAWEEDNTENSVKNIVVNTYKEIIEKICPDPDNVMYGDSIKRVKKLVNYTEKQLIEEGVVTVEEDL